MEHLSKVHEHLPQLIVTVPLVQLSLTGLNKKKTVSRDALVIVPAASSVLTVGTDSFCSCQRQLLELSKAAFTSCHGQLFWLLDAAWNLDQGKFTLRESELKSCYYSVFLSQNSN